MLIAKRGEGCAAHSPGPHDPEPRDGLPGGEARVPHHPEPDERAGAAEARAAVHGDGAVDGVAEGHEALHHVVGRRLRMRRASTVGARLLELGALAQTSLTLGAVLHARNLLALLALAQTSAPHLRVLLLLAPLLALPASALHVAGTHMRHRACTNLVAWCRSSLQTLALPHTPHRRSGRIGMRMTLRSRGRDRAVGELEVEVLDACGGEDGGVVGVRAVEPHLIARAANMPCHQQSRRGSTWKRTNLIFVGASVSFPRGILVPLLRSSAQRDETRPKSSQTHESFPMKMGRRMQSELET